MVSVGLVLSGGGTRSAVHFGAIKALEDYGFKISEAVGTSAGAITAAMYCFGIKGSEAVSKLHDNDMGKLLDFRVMPTYIWKGEHGQLRGNKVLQKFRTVVPKSYSDLEKPCHISTHNWSTGDNVIFSSGDLPLHVRASMSLPIFDMVEIDGDYYEDGGVSGNYQIDFEGWKEKPDVVIGLRIVSDEPHPRKPKNIFQRIGIMMMHMIAATAEEKTQQASDAIDIPLFTDYPAMEIGMSKKDYAAQFQDGYASAIAKLYELNIKPIV